MSDSAPGATSEAEARFDAIRGRTGLWLAPLSFVVVLAWPMPGLSPEAHRLAAVVLMTIVLWVTEAVPLAIAALLGPCVAVLLGVAPAKIALARFAHPLIFLFMGGFMIAEALRVHGFDRRAALWLMSRKIVKGSPARALVGIAIIAFVFSMWISNTATTAMMVPIAIGLCSTLAALLPLDDAIQQRARRYDEGMLITLAYAASLGGVCTPIGTAPNIIALGQLEDFAKIDFLQWMSFATPTALITLLFVLGLARLRFPPPVRRVKGLTASVRRQLRELGPMKSSERKVVIVFALAVLGWLFPALSRLAVGTEHTFTQWARAHLQESVVAILCACLLFAIPRGPEPDIDEVTDAKGRRPFGLLAWKQATRIDWGTLLLLGGGMALGDLMFRTGLAHALGKSVLGASGDQPTAFFLLAAASFLVVYMTEFCSNTATISMLLPVLIPMAVEAEIDPIPVSLTVTMAASFAFMLPVSTPPNAIAYGSGRIRIGSMIRLGSWMDLIGLLVLIAVGSLVLPYLQFG